MTDYADLSILKGMTDREIREAIAKGDAHGNAVLAAMLRERDGNPPGPIGSFRYSRGTQLKGEMLLCRREPAEHIKVIDLGEHDGALGCLCQIPTTGEILLTDLRGNLCRSSDAGRTWSEPAPLPPPISECNNIGALGALRDGTLLVAGMKGLLPVQQRDPNQIGPPIDGVVSYSTDGGKTWSKPFCLDRMGYHILEPASHLRFLELRDGTVLLGVTGNTKRTLDYFYYSDGTQVPPSGSLVRPEFRDHDQWVFRSHDKGRTWGEPTLVAEWGSETNFVELPSGKIIATIRYQREWAVEGDDPRVLQASKPQADPDFGCTIFIDTFISESTDGGYAWSEPRKASRYLEHPSDIVCLSDGTLVMVMGHKAFPQGPQVVWSRDEGKTWSESFIALDMDPKGGSGQPSALALEDDTILVSYDQCTWDEKSTTNPPATRCQLWVARFRLPQDAQENEDV